MTDCCLRGHARTCALTLQAFPDEFHLASLQAFTEACEQLLPEVDVKSLVVTLMTRIAEYARRLGGANAIPASIDAFGILRSFCDRLCRVSARRGEESV